MSEQENAPDRESNNENALRKKRVQARAERARQSSEQAGKKGYPLDMRPAGVLIRLAARFIDGVIFWVVFTLLGLLLSLFGLFGGLLYILIHLLASLSYETLLTASTWRGTLGKRVLEIKVVRGNGGKLSLGKSFGRFLAVCLVHLIVYAAMFGAGSYISPWLFFLIPVLLLFGLSFVPRKRMPHDFLAGTYVVHVGRGRSRRSSRRRKVKVSASTEVKEKPA